MPTRYVELELPPDAKLDNTPLRGIVDFVSAIQGYKDSEHCKGKVTLRTIYGELVNFTVTRLVEPEPCFFILIESMNGIDERRVKLPLDYLVLIRGLLYFLNLKRPYYPLPSRFKL